jgi:hypothetical protein
MRKSLLAALVLALVACGGDKATGPNSFTGTYTLRTVNGANPPQVVYEDDAQRIEVIDGTVVLGANNKWTGTLGARVTDLAHGLPPQSLPGLELGGGTYTLSGNTLTLDDPDDDLTFTGTVAAGTMTVSVVLFGETTNLVYTK